VDARAPTADLAVEERFRHGDETVLEVLVRTFGPAIEGALCARFPLLRPYAEDLLVDSLYRVWVRRKEFAPDRGSLYGWWLAIAFNAARDLLRVGWQQARACEIHLEDGLLEQMSGPVLHPGRAAPRGEPESTEEFSPQELAFWEVLKDLPEADRRVVLYHAQVNGEGHWAAELSGELGLSAGAVRVRRGRIMKRIRAEMARRGYSIPDEVSA
jgi:RNA polymerase sigma factor (sigma-70 family)